MAEGKARNGMFLCIRIGMVLAAVLLTLFWGSKKEGYHVDELYSYGLANSEYLPFMHFGESDYDVKDWMQEYGAGNNLIDLFRNLGKDFKIIKEASFRVKSTPIYEAYLVAQKNSRDTYSTTWVDGQAYRDYLMPSERNRFNYASVYYNQRGDVHPPLFYLLLHTICSFSPGIYSKWFGIGMNACIMGIALWVLYGMVKKYFGGEVNAACTCVLWGFSACFVTSGIFIRMYALLTLMILLFLAVHFQFAGEDFRWTRKVRRGLLLTTILGYLTHYYFVIFAGLVMLVTVIFLFLRKKGKEAFYYLGTYVFAAVLGLMIWPFSIKHVFQGYRGQASLSSLTPGSFSTYPVKIMAIFMGEDVFGGHVWVAIALAVAVIAFALIARKFKFPGYKAFVLLIPAIGYLCAVAQMVPFLSKRYFYCLYPIVFMFLIAAISYKWRETSFAKGKLQYLAPVCAAAFLLVFVNAFLHEPEELFKGGVETVEIPEKTDAVYVLPDGSWNEANEELTIMSKTRKVGIVYESNLEALSDYYADEGTTLMICIHKNLDREATIQRVKEALGVPEFEVRKVDEGNAFARAFLRKE